MSGGQITRKEGETLYLQAQLYDLEESLPLRVIADVLNNDGTILSTPELTHTSKGTFINDTAVMPSEPVIFVKYYVYEMDGTTLKAVYGVIEERFMLAPTSVITSTVILGDNIQGVIEDPSEIVGELDTTELTSTIDTTELEAAINEIELEGEIYGDS